MSDPIDYMLEHNTFPFLPIEGLDGETNLKSRRAVGGLSHLRTAHACSTTGFELECDIPEVDLYKLNAAVVLPGTNGDKERYPIDAETTLLRGCVLRNTSWVIGIVMYTGSDT